MRPRQSKSTFPYHPSERETTMIRETVNECLTDEVHVRKCIHLHQDMYLVEGGKEEKIVRTSKGHKIRQRNVKRKQRQEHRDRVESYRILAMCDIPLFE